jgi:hypothetical protein
MLQLSSRRAGLALRRLAPLCSIRTLRGLPVHDTVARLFKSYHPYGHRSLSIPPAAVPPTKDGSSPTPPLNGAKASANGDAHPDVRWTVPNAMTALRLVLGPVSAGLIVAGHLPAAVGTLCVAGFLDWADGAWARAFNAQSLLGSFLDPLADKVRGRGRQEAAVWFTCLWDSTPL